MDRILIVDDEPTQRTIVSSILRDGGYEVAESPGTENALDMIPAFSPSVILTDLRMPGMGGMALVEKVAGMEPRPEIILLTAYSSVETAVQAMKLGAYDYLRKPIERTELLMVVKRAVEKFDLRATRRKFRDHLARKSTEGLVSASTAMREVIDTANKVASSDATILIRGETGTGKERIAQLIHYKSARSHLPMTSVNCASFQETLLESELFGYEKGAFTGANSSKAGLVEETDGSTLFLDEIGDIPLAIQAKLLRLLQEKEIRRVGATKCTNVDVRIIAATNQNLEEKIRNQTFRQDLFYRLNIIPVIVPPLRDRPDDIVSLTDFFLSRYGAGKIISPEAVYLLNRYDWPGNVRELQAVIQRVCILCSGTTVNPGDLPPEINGRSSITAKPTLPPDGIVFEEWEKEMLTQALARSDGTVAEAARLLGMTYRTFQYRAEKFGLLQAG